MSAGPSHRQGTASERVPFLAMSIRPWGLLGASGALVGIATVAGLAGCLWWPLDLAAHFRVQYLMASTVLALLYLAGRRRREAAAALTLVAINGVLVLTVLVGPAPPADTGAPRLRVLLINVNTRGGDPVRVGAYVKDVDPDVLVLEEIDHRWLTALVDVRERLPYDTVETRGDNFGIGMWCRTKPARSEIVYLGPAEVPSVMAELPLGEGTLGILSTHAVPPGGKEESSWRDGQLDEVGRYLARQQVPYLLVGDLNATPWSCAYRRLVRSAKLTRGMRGRVGTTWPVGLWPLRIPIDHALHTAGVRIANIQVGPDVGSDHFPMLVEVSLSRDQAAPRASSDRQGP